MFTFGIRVCVGIGKKVVCLSLKFMSIPVLERHRQDRGVQVCYSCLFYSGTTKLCSSFHAHYAGMGKTTSMFAIQVSAGIGRIVFKFPMLKFAIHVYAGIEKTTYC